MRPTLVLLILMALVPPVHAEGIDLIVMVDTSVSMFRVFPDLVQFLFTDLLTERLRFGDTFHLLTFADRPEVEIAEAITSRESIERVLRRLLLLKPLGAHTDLVAALRYLATYALELPDGNRKSILLLTDGVHDPPPGSNALTDPAAVRRELFQTAREIARAGWRVSILRLPLAGGGTPAVLSPQPTEDPRVSTGPVAGDTPEPSAPTGPEISEPDAVALSPDGEPSGREAARDYVGDLSNGLRAPVADLGEARGDLPAAVGFPSIVFPSGTLRGGTRLPVTFVLRSGSPEALYVELTGVRREDGVELLREPATAIVPPRGSRRLRATLELPTGTPTGRQSVAVDLTFAGGLRVSPSRGVLSIDYTGRPGVVAGALGRARSVGSTLLVVLVVLGAVAFVALIGFGIRSRMDIVAWARGLGSGGRRYRRAEARGYPTVEMVVRMQNPHIGHRNVHTLRPGDTLTVGGGRSAYLVYFVAVPADMAHLTYDGSVHTFVPVHADLFPEVGGPVVDCLGREIPATSPRGYRFTMVFRPFRSPLDEINDLMRSIRVEPRHVPSTPSSSAV